MSLEISKIQNGKLQELARQCNTDDNLEYLNEEEYSIFLNKAEELVKNDKDVKRKDLRQAKDEWVNEEFVKAPKQAYKRRLEISEEFSKYVKQAGKFDGEVKNSVIGDMSPAHAYRKEIDEMYSTVATILGSGETKVDLSKREGVEELLKRREDVQKRLDAGDRSLRGVPEVLDTIAAVSKQAIVDKETIDLINIYYDKCSDVKNFDEAKKIVKKEAEKQGLMKTSYYREAYEAFEAFVSVLAMEEFEDKLPDAVGKSRREVKRDMIDKHVDGDRTYKKEVKSEKALRGVQARRNTVLERQEELTHVTADEINEELGNDLAKKLSAYIEKCKNDDGTYNLSKLSEVMQYHVGSDYLMNRSDNTSISEEFQARKGLDQHIKAETGDNPELTEKEADTIREFCRIEKENKSRLGIGAAAPIAGAAIPPAVLNALHANFVGVLGNTVVNREYAIDVFMEILTQVDVNAAGGVEQQVSEVLANNTELKKRTIEVIAGKADWAEIAKAGLEGALWGVLTALAFAVIFGESQKYEKACISLTDDGAKCKTLDEYSAWAKDTYGENKAQIMTALASRFADDKGNLDAKALYEYLDVIAGKGSNLNCLELRAGRIYNKLPEREETPTQTAAEVHNMALEHTTEPETDDSIAYVTHRVDFAEKNEDGTMKWLDKKGNFMWEDIVNAFYPDLVKACGGKMYGKDGAIRALKEAMSLKFNSETGELTMDATMRKNLIEGGNIAKVNFFPDKITTKNGDVFFKPEKVKTRTVEGEGKAKTNQGGFEGGVHIRKVPGTDTWLATDDKGYSGSASTKEDAVRVLKSASHVKEYANEKEVLEQAE